MYLKVLHKYCKTDKIRVAYYRLCESYRDEYGLPRQRMVIGLGRLSEIPQDEQKLLLCERINELIKGEPSLFTSCNDHRVEQLAQGFYGQIKSKKRVDSVPPPTGELDLVNLKTLKNKNIREVGAESICYQAIGQLKIDHYLENIGWNDEQINLATTHIISRAVYPASELKTVS